MASKTKYKVIGVYVDEDNEIIGYEMLDSNGKTQKYTNSQVYFLVGNRQVINADGHLEGSKVVLTGIGCDLRSLPVKREIK